jgi:signal peptidase I
MTTSPQHYAGNRQSNNIQGDRRILVHASLLGFLLFLAVFPFVPTVGPVFRLFTVPSTSMAPTVMLGQIALVSRASYGYSRYSFDWVELPIAGRWPSLLPKRGDVVVFRLPRDPDTFYVKRVVGLPHDRVQMIEGRLWINSVLTKREPAEAFPDPLGKKGPVPAYRESLPGGLSHEIIETDGDTGFLDNTAVFDVPDGHYFMLGDNRDNSSDSRTPADKLGVGFVPLELILGRVVASF